MDPRPDDILDLARHCVVSLSTGDAAARMGEGNMVYGLAKVLWAQVSTGSPPAACFIAAPDATITRNAARWSAGFGYGGKLWCRWSQPTVVLDVKPNACGMLVGGLQSAPSPERITARLEHMLTASMSLDGIPLRWDFTTGNHFIDVFQVHPFAAAPPLPDYAFIVHASCPELRGPTDLGPGLYWDKSPELCASADELSTPWGTLRLLTGKAASEFKAFHDRAVQFAATKRLLAAEALFADFTVISNRHHQGLHGDEDVLLGAHHSLWPEPLPLTLRPDLPAYLLSGRPNLSDSHLHRALADSDAPDFVRQAAARANLIPHGAGYALEGIRRVNRVWTSGELRFFELERQAGQAPDIVTDPTSLPVRYRGRQVLMLAIEWGLAEPLARLDPILVLKA